MTRALLSSSLIAIAAAFAIVPAHAADKAEKAAKAPAAKPYVTVNGKAIPANRADIVMAPALAQGQPNTPQLQAMVRDKLITLEVVSQEAIKKGIDKRADVQGTLDLMRQELLAKAYIGEFQRALKITDEDVKKTYDVEMATLGDKEYKARHILVDKEDEAKEIIRKLKKGEKFDELAKVSKDPSSKNKGGELDWSPKATYVPAFSAAMAGLEKGKFTETPVETKFGWHVIQLDDVRDLKLPPLDDAMKEKIIQYLRQVAAEKQIQDLRNKAKVE